MSNMFNNKWIIVALVAGAVAIVYNRVVVPFIEFSSPGVDSAVMADVDDLPLDDDEFGPEEVQQELQLVTAQYDLRKVDAAGLRWNETPERDPFSTRAELDNHQIEAVQNKAETGKVAVNTDNKLTKLTPPSVSAIVTSADRSFAVINGDILRRGDSVEGFQVNEIQNKSVRLRHVSSGRSVSIKVPK